MEYIQSQNKYISNCFLYTEEELNYIDKLERENKQSPIPFHQLLEIFPTAISAIRRELKEEIKQCKTDIQSLLELENEYRT